MEMENKKTLFSAIQPSGILTIGNYLGALKNFKKLQDDYNGIFALADLHTLTVKQEVGALKKNTYERSRTRGTRLDFKYNNLPRRTFKDDAI